MKKLFATAALAAFTTLSMAILAAPHAAADCPVGRVYIGEARGDTKAAATATCFANLRAQVNPRGGKLYLRNGGRADCTPPGPRPGPGPWLCVCGGYQCRYPHPL
jgi:hypothetical protein